MSLFLPQVKRYTELARHTQHIWVFGLMDAIPPSIENITYVPLTEAHALYREWFIIADAPEFFSALVAQDLSGFAVSDPQRRFRGAWTFEDELVHTLQQNISKAIGVPPVQRSEMGARDYRRHMATIAQSGSNLVDRLEMRNQAIKRQQVLREELIHMLVHDLRNPLTGIIGTLQLVASGRVPEGDEQKMLLRSSLDSSLRLAQMISNVLDVNKMEAGEFKLNRSALDVSQMLAMMAERWRASLTWDNKTMRIETPENLPLLMADRDVLERVLDNLISNAYKYGQNLVLRAGVRGKKMLIEVQDDGPGIPPEDREKVFAKYGQANLGKAQRKGTGLGLTFVKMAVEGHGGEVTILDAPGGGTIFHLELPVN
ncbi:MAG: hypothetical protein OHK0052_19280 [Anaerolineales bacterium]